MGVVGRVRAVEGEVGVVGRVRAVEGEVGEMEGEVGVGGSVEEGAGIKGGGEDECADASWSETGVAGGVAGAKDMDKKKRVDEENEVRRNVLKMCDNGKNGHLYRF